MDDRQADQATTQDDVALKRGVPPIAEAFGYVGGALALTALVTLVAMFWNELGVWGRVGISAAVAVAGLAAGFAVERLEQAAAKRLAGFLLALGVVGVGCAVGFLAHDQAKHTFDLPRETIGLTAGADAWAWFLGMFAVAVSGGIVWMRRRTWLQHLAFGLGVGLSAVLVLPLIPIDGPEWGPGAVLAFVGVLWGVLAYRGRLEPEAAGLTLASLGLLGGVQMMAFLAHPQGEDIAAWGVWLGVVTSLGMVVCGAGLKRFVVLVLGVVGLVGFVIELVAVVLDIGLGMPLLFFAFGLTLLVIVCFSTSRLPEEGKDARSVLVEIGGYAGGAFIVAGTAALLGEYWDDLGTPTRIAVPAIASAVGYAAGMIVGRSARTSSRRLSHALVSMGAVGAGVTTGMVVHPLALARLGEYHPEEFMYEYQPQKDPANWAVAAGSLGALVAGAITWWRRRSPVIVAVTGLACFMAVTNSVSLFRPEEIAFWLPGSILLSVGLLWVVLGVLKHLTPANWVVGAGSAMSIAATMSMQYDQSGEPQVWASVLGIALAVIALAVSIALKRGVLLGFGAAAIVIFSFMTVQQHFSGQVGAVVALLVAGVMFIAMAVLVAVMLPKMRKQQSLASSEREGGPDQASGE